LPTEIINGQSEIICGIQEEVSTDSLRKYIKKLCSFYNRNTGSDTSSADTGIGATRRWVYHMFEKFSEDNDNRLVPAYLQFDQSLFSVSQHRNIFAVLPGNDTTDKSVIIVEAHIDSRCETSCDIACKAPGADDNGSGSALVIELARVMSKYTFDQTFVFLLTISEEQGLNGATAFAQYCVDNNINIKAVQNNDVVGGIHCGQTASPPSKCTYEGEVDSTHLRIFSNGSFLKKSRNFARYVDLIYKEKLLPIVNVPMTMQVMDMQDRVGRGGDHIPFSDMNFTAIRFTGAHEHGDGSPGVGYTDRQHTTNDILGVDTDSNGVIDDYFVDMNYLKRNAVINGTVMSLVAMSPETPDFDLVNELDGLTVQITGQTQYPRYRVGVRTSSATDFDANFDHIYSFEGGLNFTIPGLVLGTTYFVCVASVDSNGITSMFSADKNKKPNVSSGPGTEDPYDLEISCGPSSFQELTADLSWWQVELLPLRPNPSIGKAEFVVKIDMGNDYKKAYILITDILGQAIVKLPIQLGKSINRILYHYIGRIPGIYNYSLVIDNHIVKTRKALFLDH